MKEEIFGEWKVEGLPKDTPVTLLGTNYSASKKGQNGHAEALFPLGQFKVGEQRQIYPENCYHIVSPGDTEEGSLCS